jgi:YidC/Oxa1 family membrane protein insertase
MALKRTWTWAISLSVGSTNTSLSTYSSSLEKYFTNYGSDHHPYRIDHQNGAVDPTDLQVLHRYGQNAGHQTGNRRAERRNTEDPTKMQQEQMKLFGQLGVSPISGCLPLVAADAFFLFAMFFFFPNAIELRQQSFLWAHDLSTYDSILRLPFAIPFYGSHVSLFTILMTVSQIAYTHFNNQLTAQAGPMKNLGYIMPVVLCLC